jgi:transcriptional regulator with XRE-family HTH domain
MVKKTNILKALGDRIRILRTKKGLSQQKLAELSDLSYKYLGEVERAQQNPTIQTLQKIADGLEISLNELVQIEEHNLSRKEIEMEIQHVTKQALSSMPDEDLPSLLTLLRLLLPGKKTD